MGEKRSLASVKKLAELNEYVVVSAHTGEFSDEFIHEFDVSSIRV